MKKETTALVLNFISFGSLFLLFKTLIGAIIPLSYIPLIAFSALLTSVFSPKFLLNKGKLFMKIPLCKKPIQL